MTRKHYEILFILRPLQEEQLGKTIENYRSMVTRDGDIHRFENCGLRPFAYMIDNLRRGYYILMNIECSVEVIQKIEKALRADESVLRFLLMVTKERVSGVSPLSKSVPESAASQRADKENKPAELKSESAAANEVKEAKEKEKAGEIDTMSDTIEATKEDESADLESSATSEASEQEEEKAETEESDTTKEDAKRDTIEATKEGTEEEEAADLENTAENPKEKE